MYCILENLPELFLLIKKIIQRIFYNTLCSSDDVKKYKRKGSFSTFDI